MSALEARGLAKTYRGGAEEVSAVRGASLALEEGELVLLMGPSGSGKTTLLSILGCILTPDRGRLWVRGEEVAWDERRLYRYRRELFGFVYQSYNLLASLSVHANVRVPLTLAGRGGAAARARADEALERVGVTHRARFLPGQLSGGEQQRVAIARALVTDPPVLLCDEPTGNLDSENGRRVLGTLRELATEAGKAILVVTHDERARPFADRMLRMEDGELRGT